MKVYHLWQKPYGHEGNLSRFLQQGVVFCPFLHNARANEARAVYRDFINVDHEIDIDKLRQYHISMGYTYLTGSSTISQYIHWFKNLEPGDILYVPRRSESKREPVDIAYKLKVSGHWHYGEVEGFYGVMIQVQVLESAVSIPGVFDKRKSMAIIRAVDVV